MERITAMKITALSFNCFRNHMGPEGYAFGDITYITGDNGAGKTTMAHGVAYALYGVSFFGEQAIALAAALMPVAAALAVALAA